MTIQTKRLLEALERHAEYFKGHQPCLQLSSIPKHDDGKPVLVYPADLREMVEEIQEMDKTNNVLFA